jgi:DNA polymerase-3 subunit epsilon
VIHNAAFDIGFLNTELALLDRPPIETVCPDICDTLRMAKELFPGKKNNLNALCDRYGVDNTHRTLHGALLDAEILAEVYVAMTRGQESLIMEVEHPNAVQFDADGRIKVKAERKALSILRASDAELAEHSAQLAAIQKESKGKCLWLSDEAQG